MCRRQVITHLWDHQSEQLTPACIDVIHANTHYLYKCKGTFLLYTSLLFLRLFMKNKICVVT